MRNLLEQTAQGRSARGARPGARRAPHARSQVLPLGGLGMGQGAEMADRPGMNETTECIELWLPWPPSINRYYAPGRTGGLYLSARGSAYRRSCELAVHEQIGGHKTIDYRMAVDIVLFPPTRRKCDIDNYLKALFDALQHTGVISDDALIDRLSVLRGDIRTDGCCRLLISAHKKAPL